MVGAVFVVLVLASAIGWILALRVTSASGRATVDNINARVRAWWVMAAIFMTVVATGTTVSIVLFTLMSFLALREFVTLVPTKASDHRALFWSFFIVTPVQYFLIWLSGTACSAS